MILSAVRAARKGPIPRGYAPHASTYYRGSSIMPSQAPVFTSRRKLSAVWKQSWELHESRTPVGGAKRGQARELKDRKPPDGVLPHPAVFSMNYRLPRASAGRGVLRLPGLFGLFGLFGGLRLPLGIVGVFGARRVLGIIGLLLRTLRSNLHGAGLNTRGGLRRRATTGHHKARGTQ